MLSQRLSYFLLDSAQIEMARRLLLESCLSSFAALPVALFGMTDLCDGRMLMWRLYGDPSRELLANLLLDYWASSAVEALSRLTGGPPLRVFSWPPWFLVAWNFVKFSCVSGSK